MEYDLNLQTLKRYLETVPNGDIPGDRKSQLEVLVAQTWDSLSTDDTTNMRPEKLIGRMEDPRWERPNLYFAIERHGQTVNGSTRATVYTWRIDLEMGQAIVVGEKRRQLYATDERLDVKPIAKSLAEAIVGGASDARLKRAKDGSVRVMTNNIIPMTNKQTTAGRRKRLRVELDGLLKQHGWGAVRPNVYKSGS
ncbi:hypothetical protein [Hyphomicrobium sp. 2TAF46]|uniref:hypothetical protein n=1 Tax=Hyphomicrobium sp. 2TAF46 TaxID=3233019 RepID=UPI003F93A613